MISLLNLTHTLASHGLSITVLTTPQNQSLLIPFLQRASSQGLQIQSLIFPLPPTKGLPSGCENAVQLPYHLIPLFMDSLKDLAHPIKDWFQEQKKSSNYEFGPHVCIISDFFLGWTQNTAAKLSIPRIMYHSSSAFVVSVIYSLWKYMPHEQVSSNDDTIHIPKVPHPVSFQRYQISCLAHPYKRFDAVSEFMRCSMNSNVKKLGYYYQDLL